MINTRHQTSTRAESWIEVSQDGGKPPQEYGDMQFKIGALVGVHNAKIKQVGSAGAARAPYF